MIFGEISSLAAAVPDIVDFKHTSKPCISRYYALATVSFGACCTATRHVRTFTTPWDAALDSHFLVLITPDPAEVATFGHSYRLVATVESLVSISLLLPDVHSAPTPRCEISMVHPVSTSTSDQHATSRFQPIRATKATC